MITHNDTIKVQSNVNGSAVRMGIAAEDMGHIMGLLAGAYSNKPRALIREYSTNAFDAHTEAGQTRPIEVALPTMLTPFLTVTDYGTGLSVEGIHEVYAQYGRSTKRESNKYNGALGIGCKSALAYCSMFTVQSVQNGTRITVQVNRENDGAGTMTVVDTVATDDPNGTTVSIPIRQGDIPRFQREADDFYSVWDPATVLVNGRPPRRFEGLKLSDSLYIVSSGGSRIIMGNVAYPCPALDSISSGGYVYAYVPIGTVGFPPSREALDDSRRTTEAVERIAARARKEIVGAIQREIDASPSGPDAVKVIAAWSRYAPSNQASYTFKGQPIPTEFSGTAGPLHISPISSYRPGRAEVRASTHLSNWPKSVFVYNFAPAKFVAAHKYKIVQQIENHSLSGVERVVCFDGPMPPTPLIDPARCFDWDEVRKIRLNHATVSSPGYRIPGSYDIRTEAGVKCAVPGSDIRQDKPIFYLRSSRHGGHPVSDALAGSYPAFTLVLLPLNRVEKFKRDVPSAVEGREAVRLKFEEWKAALTPDQREALAMHDARATRTFRTLNAGRLKDPLLKHAAQIATMPVHALVEQRAAFAGVVQVDAPTGAWNNPLSNYPLFSDNALNRHTDATYRYLNNEYEFNNA